MYHVASLCGAALVMAQLVCDDRGTADRGAAASASTDTTAVTLQSRPPSDAVPTCTDTGALLLARAVILAAPLLITDEDMYLNNGEPLRAFVSQYRRFFGTGGSSVRCASVAGPRLVAAGIRLYDPNAYGRVMESAPLEVAHLAGDVANRINESSVYFVELGQELTWLGSVLPAVARDDMAPFFSAAYPLRDYKRQQLAAMWPAVQAMCRADGCAEWLSMAMPQMKRQVDDVGLGMTYAMVMLAQ